MEVRNGLELYTLEEMLDEQEGKIGTPERDEHERLVAEAVNAYRVGEAIKAERLRQQLTQAQLGERAYVGRAQISRLERTGDVSFSTVRRVLRALGVVPAMLEIGQNKKLALW